MIKLILFILLISSCQDESCRFGEREFNIFLNVLLTKKIIEKSEKKLNINFKLDNNLSFPFPEFVVLDRDTVKLFVNRVDLTTINILNVKKSVDNSLNIVFLVNKLTRKIRGDVNFMCQDKKLIFKDIRYLSEIN